MNKIEQLPKTKNRNRHQRVWPKIAVVIVVILTIIGVVTGIKLAYDNGKKAGVNEVREQVQQNLKALADAVTKKANIGETLQQLIADVPSELDADGIAKYVENLERLTSSMDDQQVKGILDDYKQSWAGFQEIYTSEDNKKIETGFAELRAKAAETGEKITELMNQRIKSASENLAE